jgi:hypothetical protein
MFVTTIRESILVYAIQYQSVCVGVLIIVIFSIFLLKSLKGSLATSIID